jgi:hypothetical protein
MHVKESKNKLFKSFVNKPKEQEFRVHRGIPPINLKKGELFYNFKLNILYIFDGKKWKEVG